MANNIERMKRAIVDAIESQKQMFEVQMDKKRVKIRISEARKIYLKSQQTRA